ncbi:DNA polymerase sliding clamp [Saliphagus sp. LR7]|uniref:DNA polymerase sliding clamp n=1 Tax=Saliphagus sp. LR7 TaxID=2282654 RepID=UPI000DF80AB5|nr:DNA polymerase sliding clamp [Saliphagus sp. LR7]
MTTTDTRPTRTEQYDDEPPVELVCSADTLSTTLEAVGSVVSECRLRLGPDGLGISAIGPATVAAASVELEPAAFDSYRSDGRTLGIDLSRIDDALSVAPRGPIRLWLDPDGRLRLAAEGLEYAIGLLDPDSIREPPDLEAFSMDGAAVQTEGETVGSAIRAAGTLADHLTLGVTDDPAFVAAADGDTDEMSLTVPESDLEGLERPPTEPSRSTFSLSYLEAIHRVLPDEAVRLRLGDDEPLELAFDLADGAGRARLVVCPRIRRG